MRSSHDPNNTDLPQTWHTITTFIAAMLLHPKVQERAHEEIDRVIGRDRLPDFNDRDSLPYLQCVMQEVFRYVVCVVVVDVPVQMRLGAEALPAPVERALVRTLVVAFVVAAEG